jgi:AcrR family transcriptional regulator
VSTNRPYRSSLRENRAQDTRRRIRQAALTLFEADGFATTTVAQIARAAGVSAPTVYAVFGSKAGIVREMMDELEQLAGGDEAAERILGETDPALQLTHFVHWIRLLFERGAPILRAAAAARTDPEVAAMTDVGDARRREGAGMLVEGWAARGAVRADLDLVVAAETFWLLTSAQVYFLSIDDLGWSPDHYEHWLGATLARQLLA